MRTFASWTSRWLRDRGGATAVEFALIIPPMMLAVGGIAELGNYFQQSHAVEKAVRSAAMYAARSDLPLDNATINTISQIVRTGQSSGGSNLVAGWTDNSAQVTVTVTDVTTGGTTVSVINIAAQVPYTPIVPVVEDLVRLQTVTISATQEQVHIGG